MSIYGFHTIPTKITHDDFCLSIEEFGDHFIYKRKIGDAREEKLILGKKKKIQINPIPPLTKPKHITPYLLIGFTNSFVIDARATTTLYLKFPVEIGVFLPGKEIYETLDTLTLVKSKYTLYGDPLSGIICRYVKSDIHTEIPSVDICRAGVIELKVANKTLEWAEVSNVVFNAYSMQIYYNDRMISLKAKMEILNRTSAETNFIDSPLNPEMRKSIEYFSTKKHPLASTKFVMREGL